MKSNFVQYYVEGEDEEKLVNVLKSDLRVIRPGKVQRLNVVECEFTNARLISLRHKTMVVLIFDTDTSHIETLNKNLMMLKKCPAISELVTIPQVFNLEDELVRSCGIKQAIELLGSKTKKEFKSDLIKCKNLGNKLTGHQFDINRLWSQKPQYPYHYIVNQAKKIKLPIE